MAIKMPHCASASLARKRKGRVIVTGAVSNSDVNRKQWVGLQTYAEHLKCPLFVMPVKYKNVSAFSPGTAWEPVWAEELYDNIISQPVHLGSQVVLRPDINIEATCLYPLQRKQPINGHLWTVFGSPKTAMEVVAAEPRARPKRMYTTGAVTHPNYSRTDRGSVAEFHHTYNALLIEWDDSRGAVWVRQLGANKEGVFNDLDVCVKGTRISDSKPMLALVLADEHVGVAEPSVVNATHGPQGLVALLKPQWLVRHDVLDAYSCSPHEDNDEMARYRKFLKGKLDVRAELDSVVAYLNSTTPAKTTNVMVASNHHDHLERWLNKVDHKRDPLNADLIHELRLQQLRNARNGEMMDAFVTYAKPRVTVPTVWVDYHTPFLVNNIDLGQHGHNGVNGARGSLRGYAKTSRRTVTGHTHTPGICLGSWSCGGMVGRQKYEHGYSTHDTTHVGLYTESGKRTLIDIVNGRFRL